MIVGGFLNIVAEKKWLICSPKTNALTTRAINRAIKWEGKTDQLEGGK